MKSDKWDGMFLDLLPGDELVGGSVIKCHVENPEPLLSFCTMCEGVL